MTRTTVNIEEEFDLKHALDSWLRDRRVDEADLIMILRRDLEHCLRNHQPHSAANIYRMLGALGA